MRRFALTLIAILSLAVVSRAYGLSMLEVTDGTDYIAVDSTGAVSNSAGATVQLTFGAQGDVTIKGKFGVWTVLLTGGTSKPNIGSATSPEMDVGLSQGTSNAAGMLTVLWADQGFGPIPSGSSMPLMAGFTQPAGGTVTAKLYYDSANGIFVAGAGATPTGALIGTIGPVSTSPSFSANVDSGPIVPGTAPFSLTQTLKIVHTTSGNTTTTGDFMTGPPVPEPASLLLLGSGLAGFGYLRRRRRQGA